MPGDNGIDAGAESVRAPLSQEEQTILLSLARRALEAGVTGKPLGKIALDEYPARLRETGASFVTLTAHGRLRGCIGTLDAYQPLAQDVADHALDAAIHDYRFSSVQPHELSGIEIEISRLTPPQPLIYDAPQELASLLRPGMDGVILRDGNRKATFLPQVWDQLCDPAVFLNHLCQKMGAEGDLWRKKMLKVAIYQVEEFHE